MSKPIREFLEALGVAVKSGSQKMVCPACHEEKLTASDRKNVATCWGCGKRIVPGKERIEQRFTWPTKVMGVLAARCLKELPKRQQTLEWLTQKRKLPLDVEWLTSNMVGAVPADLPVDALEAKAKAWLAEDMVRDRANVSTDDKNAMKDLKAVHEWQEKHLEAWFKTLRGTLQVTGVIGAVALIYTDRYDNCTSINIRPHYLEQRGERRFFRLQPGSKRGLFNPKQTMGSRWDDHNLPPVVVEGEFNWLSLLAINDEWRGDDDVSEWAIAGCAMGGKQGADGEELRPTFDEAPLVIYDNDALGDDGLPGGYDLVRGLINHTPVYAVRTQAAKDIDELCVADGENRHRLTPEMLLRHWNLSTYTPRPYAVTGKSINQVLGEKPNRMDYQRAADILWDDLQMRGELYRVKTTSGSFGLMVLQDVDECLKTRNRVVQVLRDHPSWMELMHEYRIGTSDASTAKLGQDVATRIQVSKAPYIELHVLSHYDQTSKCLYVDELTHTLKLRPDGRVQYLQNGDDGVVFTPAGDSRKAVIGKLGSLRVRDGEFSEQILDSVRWDEEHGLGVDAAKQLYKAHVLTIFFDTLMQAKVCPVFEGKAGGGKNTISNLTGRIFEGSRFNILKMPDKPEQLDTLTADRLYVAFDEFDASDGEVEGAFRSWCTRLWSERRELYNTWTTSIRPLARGMAVSTNGNPVRDVATGQRQLMFHVKPRQDAMTDESYVSLGGSLYPAFMKHRNAIWSELIADLRAMVVHLGKADLSAVRTSFRMSDFGVLFLAVADGEGWGDEARTMLRQMQNVQMRELAKKHTLVELMTQYLIEHPERQNVLMTLGEWRERLLLAIPLGDRQTRDKFSVGHFKKMFTGASASIMEREFVMAVKRDPKLKQNKYAFSLRMDENDAAGQSENVSGEGAEFATEPPEMERMEAAEVY